MSQGYRKLAIKQLPKTSKSQTPEARYWKKFRVSNIIIIDYCFYNVPCEELNLRSDPDSDRYHHALNNLNKIMHAAHMI